MFEPQEADRVARHLSDKARKVARVGKQLIVPHKFKENGEIVTQENFNPKTDLSKLNQNHWKFLEIFQRTNWDMDAACKESGMAMEDVKRMYKKVKYFDFEQKREKALVSILNPNFIKAKHVDNVFTNTLQDSQHKSLDQLAKIEGLHKSTSLNVHAHVFQRPPMTPEAEEATRKFFDDLAGAA